MSTKTYIELIEDQRLQKGENDKADDMFVNIGHLVFVWNARLERSLLGEVDIFNDVNAL